MKFKDPFSIYNKTNVLFGIIKDSNSFGVFVFFWCNDNKN